MVIANFIQTIVTNGISGSILSTLQKEFYLTSFEGGLFIAIHDLTAVCAAPIVGYFGGLHKTNKMRLISINMLLVSVGSYVIGILVFLKNPDASIYSVVDDVNICRLNQTQSNVDYVCSPLAKSSDDTSNVKNLQYLLYVGNGIIGVGSVALLSVGVVYIEKIVPEDKSAMCQAVYNAIGMYCDIL
jgi:MFS family permease